MAEKPMRFSLRQRRVALKYIIAAKNLLKKPMPAHS